MSLEDLRDELARRAHAVQDLAERVKEEFDDSRRRSMLDHELDRLFMELGIEVYQRMRAGEPVEDSVVVQDIVDQVAEVELRLLDTQESEAAEATEAPEPG